MPPKRKTTCKNNSQAKLKYINTCIKSMIDSLPCQTFVYFPPNDVQVTTQCLVLNMEQGSTQSTQSNLKRKFQNNSNILNNNIINTTKKKSQSNQHNVDNNTINNFQINSEISSGSKIQLNECFLDVLPHHPNIALQCVFCKKSIQSRNDYTCIEQPQARKRYTPVCVDCITI